MEYEKFNELMKEHGGTAIHGDSDDNVYGYGEYNFQYSHYGTDDMDHGIYFKINDGTMLEVKYVKNGMGVWGIKVLAKGELFDKCIECNDEEDDIYSDIVLLKKGVTKIEARVFEYDEWEVCF